MALTKIIYRKIAILLACLAVFLIFPIIVSLIYDRENLLDFVYSFGICASISTIFFLLAKSHGFKYINQKPTLIFVVLSYVILPLFGALPYMFSHQFNGIEHSILESISGFTTTGATYIPNVENLSPELLFWRALTQWIGGVFVIVVGIAIFPDMGIGGMRLYYRDSSKFILDTITPRPYYISLKLFAIYCCFTFAEVILLNIFGMDTFNALCHSFSTISTGGFSTKNIGLSYWNSDAINGIVALFMFLSAVNFTIYYILMFGSRRQLIAVSEFRWYFYTAVGTILLTAGYFSVHSQLTFLDALAKVYFQVISAISTTGFSVEEYNHWPSFLIALITLLMIVGGSAGSSSGGVKMLRLRLVLKNSILEFKRILHPNAVLPVRVDNQIVEPKTVSNLHTFVFLYLTIICLGTILIASLGYDFESSFYTILASINNIGDSNLSLTPFSSFDTVSLWVFALFMILGRLEIFGLLLIFSKNFWRKGSV